MLIISSMRDLIDWILNANPSNIAALESGVERLSEAIRETDGRPRWGADWSEWLVENAKRIADRI